MAVAVKQATSGSSGSSSTTLSATLPGAPTSGNLLVFCMGGDKNTGALTLTGFSQIYSLLSASVSLYFWQKISAGTETTINPSWANTSAAGNVAWYAELEDTAVAGSDWQISGQASNITNETTVNSWATGTTGTLTDAGLGVALDCIDSSQSITSGPAFNNSYSLIFDPQGFSGRGTPAVGSKTVTAGGTTNSTFSYTGTADQNSGAVVVFFKASAEEPASLLLHPRLRTHRGVYR